MERGHGKLFRNESSTLSWHPLGDLTWGRMGSGKSFQPWGRQEKSPILPPTLMRGHVYTHTHLSLHA